MGVYCYKLKTNEIKFGLGNFIIYDFNIKEDNSFYYKLYNKLNFKRLLKEKFDVNTDEIKNIFYKYMFLQNDNILTIYELNDKFKEDIDKLEKIDTKNYITLKRNFNVNDIKDYFKKETYLLLDTEEKDFMVNPLNGITKEDYKKLKEDCYINENNDLILTTKNIIGLRILKKYNGNFFDLKDKEIIYIEN